jgi:MiaB/RimO family radical SAM methylthiotransferase
MKAVYLESSGFKCESNAYLSSQIIIFLKHHGYRMVDSAMQADYIVLTTCGFRVQEMEHAYAIARKYGDAYPSKTLIVSGCAVDTYPLFRSDPQMRCVGPRELAEFDRIFAAKRSLTTFTANEIEARFFDEDKGSRFWIQIGQGCVNNCAYCAIKKAKQGPASKPIPEILEEVRRGVAQGKGDLVLLADDCGSYGADIGCDTADLLQALAHLPELRGSRSRVYLNAFEPGRLLKLFPRMKEALAAGIIGHMDIDIQSGSDRLVAQMNRRYKVAQVLETVSQIRELAPRTTLSTEMIFALPGETRREFAQSIQAALHFNDALFLKYSPCPGTPMADRTGRLDEDEVGYRIAVLKKLAVTTGYRCVYHL